MFGLLGHYELILVLSARGKQRELGNEGEALWASCCALMIAKLTLTTTNIQIFVD